MSQKIGMHFRVLTSLKELVERAQALDLPIFQNFLIEQETGKPLQLNQAEIDEFKKITKDFSHKFAHAAYWINLASGTSRGGQYILKKELELAAKLGYDGIVLHPGSAIGHELQEDGFAAIIRRLDRLLEHSSMIILLENTAHGNQSIGGSLEDLKEIKSRLKKPEQIKFCIDTAHAHSFGYDLSSPEKVEAFIKMVDEVLGLEHVWLIHFNDSLEKFNSKKDRHAIPGQGTIGESLKTFIQHPALRDKPFLIELQPMEFEEQKMIIDTVRSWCKGA